MSIKRRDNRNRILRNGESQGKDGKYRFTFYENGTQKCFYSWRLERTDRLPEGKRDCEALRDMIDDYYKRQSFGLHYSASKITVFELADKYTRQRKNVKSSTQTGYRTVLNILKKDPFSDRTIDQVKTSDAKMWLISLQEVQKKSYSTIHTIRGVLRPAFRMAVEDDLIPKNPFDFELSKVIVNDSVTREAVSRKEERAFLEFTKQDKHFSKYYEAVYILFKTGMRISEFCGLTLNDIDLKNKTVTIDHQLIRSSDMRYLIETPKTDAGNRTIPISDEVCECFRIIIENRKKPRKEPVIEGYSQFLFLDKNDMPMVALHWEKYFQHILQKYNKIYKQELPKITPHVCRHTYCSNMAKTGINPKTLQYLMGHSDISVTLNTYTHVKFEDAKEDLAKMNLV